MASRLFQTNFVALDSSLEGSLKFIKTYFSSSSHFFLSIIFVYDLIFNNFLPPTLSNNLSLRLINLFYNVIIRKSSNLCYSQQIRLKMYLGKEAFVALHLKIGHEKRKSYLSNDLSKEYSIYFRFNGIQQCIAFCGGRDSVECWKQQLGIYVLEVDGSGGASIHEAIDFSVGNLWIVIGLRPLCFYYYDLD